MSTLHGIIFAYHAKSELGELVRHRTSASLPFCSRYRLIDLALSSLINAGVRDVGVIMQCDYQSLLDHLGSGKAWDLSRTSGGLHLLPPFGMAGLRTGEYRGSLEALSAMHLYLSEVNAEHIILCRGDLVSNVDLSAAVRRHLSTGADITEVCSAEPPAEENNCFLPDADGFSGRQLCHVHGRSEGVYSLEISVIRKRVLMELIGWARACGKISLHRDAYQHHLQNGGRICLYLHEGYAKRVSSVADYFQVNMDMLLPQNRACIFPAGRPVRTRGRAEVSTYYGEKARSENSLVANGCYIEGELENCILFSGVRVEKGVHLKNCILMQDTVICEGAALKFIISDKDVRVSPYVTLTGSEKLPLVIPKGSEL